jgi:hypothetical protein
MMLEILDNPLLQSTCIIYRSDMSPGAYGRSSEFILNAHFLRKISIDSNTPSRRLAFTFLGPGIYVG